MLASPGRTLLAPLLITAAALAEGRAARASCAAPTQDVLFSYPAEGATDVPTNARVFVLTASGFLAGRAELNGQSIDSDPGGPAPGWKPTLQPHTEYLMEIRKEVPSGASLSLRFTTGAGPLPAGAAPAPPLVERAISMASRDLTLACRRALYIGTCFDTGQPTHVVLETRSRPQFFLLTWQPPAVWPETVPRPSSPPQPHTIHWPSECGHPEVFGSGSGCFGSYRLTAVGPTGEVTTADYGCEDTGSPPPPQRLPQHYTGSGCSTGGCHPAPHGNAVWTILATILASGLLGTTLRRRSIAPSPQPSPRSRGERETE